MTSIGNLRMNPQSMWQITFPSSFCSTTSFAGGQKSGLAILNPGSEDPRIRIRVYTDGFLIEDSEFRSLENPRNSHFLEMVKSGEVPEELRERATTSGGALNVELVEVTRNFDPAIDQKVTPQSGGRLSSTAVAFRGEGRSLVASSTPRQLPMESPTIEKDLGVPNLDHTKPKTTIQIRFSSGSRSVRTFNTDSCGVTVLELVASAYGVSPENTTLIAGFPPRPIPHSQLASTSILELGLSNSVVTVSFK